MGQFNYATEKLRKQSMQGDVAIVNNSLSRHNTPDIQPLGQQQQDCLVGDSANGMLSSNFTFESPTPIVVTYSTDEPLHQQNSYSEEPVTKSFLTSDPDSLDEITITAIKTSEKEEYAPLTEDNLARNHTHSQSMSSHLSKQPAYPKSTTTLKWTWGDLPIKSTDPSIADLHSLTANMALLKRRGNLSELPSHHSGMFTNDSWDRNQSPSELASSRVNSALTIDDKLRAWTPQSPLLNNDSPRVLSPFELSEQVVESPSSLELAEDMRHSSEFYNQTDGYDIEAVTSPSWEDIQQETHTRTAAEVSANNNTETISNVRISPLMFRMPCSSATVLEVATALTAGDSNRILSLCAHILSGETAAPEIIPDTPEALRQVLMKYALTEDAFARAPFEVVTNPNLVVVVNDLLIPWRLVHSHLTTTAEGEEGTSLDPAGDGNKPLINNSLIPHDKAAMWAGMNVNDWQVDVVKNKTTQQLHHIEFEKQSEGDDDCQIDYGQHESLSDRSSTADNRSSLSLSKEGDSSSFYPENDIHGELLNGPYGSWFRPPSGSTLKATAWTKPGVDWNSHTDLTKMQSYMFSLAGVPDLLRPYVGVEGSSLKSHASSELLDDTNGEDEGEGEGEGLIKCEHSLLIPALQASRSHESGLDSLNAISKIENNDDNKNKNNKKNSLSSSSFRSGAPKGLEEIAPKHSAPNKKDDSDVDIIIQEEGEEDGEEVESSKVTPSAEVDFLSLDDISPDDVSPGPARGDIITNNDESDTDSFYSLSFDDVESCANSSMNPPQDGTAAAVEDTGRGNPSKRVRKYLYRKSLVPNQEQLKAMNLKNGRNEITFKVEGEASLQAHLYVWPPDAKVVVADIEGAIFVSNNGKSLGSLVMSLWGGSSSAQKDTHEGLAQLFNNIAKNGYHFLYIATTPNASSKDDLLKSQGSSGSDSAGLPLGPVFLPPDALIQTFGAERTDLYKAAALRGVRTLFVTGQHNPYHAAFGAHEKDVRAFGRCGIPQGRTFLVNEKGEITTVVSSTVKRTFPDMNAMLHEVFPTISNAFSVNNNAIMKSCDAAEDAFGDVNFWKVPLPMINI